jgi:hypothetical protein
MNEAWFDSLPALRRNRKYAFEAMHAIACSSPRPVAVKISSGHKKLPVDLWPAAEFIAAAMQGEEVFEGEACNIEAFLLQLLSKAVVAANVLGSNACLGHKGLLSLFATRAKSSATMGKPRNGTAQPISVKSSNDAILDAKETCVFSEAELASAMQNIGGSEPRCKSLQMSQRKSKQIGAQTQARHRGHKSAQKHIAMAKRT